MALLASLGLFFFGGCSASLSSLFLFRSLGSIGSSISSSFSSWARDLNALRRSSALFRLFFSFFKALFLIASAAFAVTFLLIFSSFFRRCLRFLTALRSSFWILLVIGLHHRSYSALFHEATSVMVSHFSEAMFILPLVPIASSVGVQSILA
jgi:hypothetical protein